jgi:hypothetical protein
MSEASRIFQNGGERLTDLVQPKDMMAERKLR